MPADIHSAATRQRRGGPLATAGLDAIRIHTNHGFHDARSPRPRGQEALLGERDGHGPDRREATTELWTSGLSLNSLWAHVRNIFHVCSTLHELLKYKVLESMAMLIGAILYMTR